MNKDNLLKNKFLVISIVAVLCSLLIFFAYRFFTPFGAIVSYQFNSMLDRDKLSKIKGAQETSSFNPTQTGVLQIPQQTIRQNVVTFNLKLITKPVEGVWVNLKFKNDPREIKIGVRGSQKENYQYKPLYNQILNSLTWDQISNGDTTLWQREKKYNDISELLSKPPASDEAKIATYFYDPFDNTINGNSVSVANNLVIEKNLRGSHNLFVRVDKMPLILNIEKQDANVYKGEDVLMIQVYKDNNKIIEKEILDDGVPDVSNLMMSPQSEKIKINNTPLGIYKVILLDKSNGSDVRITKIETNQQSLVFASHIFLYNNQPNTLWTNSKLIKIPNVGKGNAQIAKLDDTSNLNISQPGRSYEFDLKSIKQKEIKKDQEIYKLTFNKGLLSIDGDGYIAFSKAALVNLEPIKKVDLVAVTNINAIDYIIANYQQVKKDGEWYTVQAYFDPQDIKIDGDKLYFSLESPELSNYGGEIVIDNLEVTVKKPGWLKGIVSPSPKIETKKSTPNFIEQIINFFKNLFPQKNSVVPPPPVPTETPAPTPTSPPRFQDLINITVLNGGAGRGSAGKFASVLVNNGYINSVASNSATFDYRNAVMRYQKTDSQPFKEAVAEIKKLLLLDYNTVIEEQTEKEALKITVILGENPKTITSTPTKSLTPTTKPTP